MVYQWVIENKPIHSQVIKFRLYTQRGGWFGGFVGFVCFCFSLPLLDGGEVFMVFVCCGWGF